MITISEIQNKLFKTTKASTVAHEGEVFENRQKVVQSSFCSGQVQEMHLEDIFMCRLNLDFTTRKKMRFDLQKECINLYLLFDGHSRIKLDDQPEFYLNTGTHNLFYTPSCSGEIQTERCHYDLFYLHLPVATFQEYTRQNKGVFIPFFKGVKNKECAFLRREAGIIGHRIHRIVNEICECDRQEEIRPLFIKAKIMELLSVQMEQLCNLCSPPSSLSTETAQKMFAVRDFMLEHIGEYHSLKSLSKGVGTNEYTLKQEFKNLFGMTVFGFWNEVKMEKAQKLLLETEKSIKQISEIIGYKNPQHFSTAFKNKFHVPPSAFRKINNN